MRKETLTGEKQDLNFATQWFADLAESMNEIYKKQIDMSFDMYNSFFKQNTGEPNWNLWGLNFFRNNMELFQKNISSYTDLTKKFMEPAGSQNLKNKEGQEISETIMEICNRQIDHFKKFNEQLFQAFDKSFKEQVPDFENYTESFRKRLSENFDASMKTIKSILATYKETADFSVEANKRLVDEIGKQVEATTKSNLEFWTEMLKSINLPEEDKETKAQAKKTVKETVK